MKTFQIHQIKGSSLIKIELLSAYSQNCLKLISHVLPNTKKKKEDIFLNGCEYINYEGY